jgi:hypothetical protein
MRRALIHKYNSIDELTRAKERGIVSTRLDRPDAEFELVVLAPPNNTLSWLVLGCVG